MTWAIVAAVGIAVVGTVMSNNKANAAQGAQNTENMNAYTNDVKATMDKNDAIEQANTTNMIRAGYQASVIGLQTARLKEQAATAGWSQSAKGVQALAAVDVNANASGQVGASVDAVANDIRKKSDEAQIAVNKQWYQAAENQNFKLDSLVMQAQDAQRSPLAIPDISTVNTRSAYNADPYVAGASAGLSKYASNQFSLGSSSSGSGPGVDASTGSSYMGSVE